jgi:hypothetical protein
LLPIIEESAKESAKVKEFAVVVLYVGDVIYETR